jgi:hypothetical protein
MAYAPVPKSIAFGPFSSGPNAARQKQKVSANDRGTPSATLGRHSVCVRLCDGFHYPVADYSGPDDDAAHSAVCAGMCPGAPTRLYVQPAGSDDIQDAISVRDHKSYRALPVAFRHTTNRDNTCSCHAPGESAASNVSLYKDFTLRRGDSIMTEKGFKVFRGAANLPYKQADFVSLAASRDLATGERSILGAIERASAPGRKVTPRAVASKKTLPFTPVVSRTVTDEAGKSIRLIGPQAMLTQATQAKP